MKKIHVLLSCAAALAIAGCNNEPAVEEGAETEVATIEPGAEGLGTEGQQTLGQPASWDADNDKLFDENEFTGFGDQGFAGWDADEDDQIGPDEFNRGWTTAGFTNADQAFGEFDANSDRVVAQDEFFSEARFTQYDANNNDVLEREEFAYYGM